MSKNVWQLHVLLPEFAIRIQLFTWNGILISTVRPKLVIIELDWTGQTITHSLCLLFC